MAKNKKPLTIQEVIRRRRASIVIARDYRSLALR